MRVPIPPLPACSQVSNDEVRHDPLIHDPGSLLSYNTIIRLQGREGAGTLLRRTAHVIIPWSYVTLPAITGQFPRRHEYPVRNSPTGGSEEVGPKFPRWSSRWDLIGIPIVANLDRECRSNGTPPGGAITT